jgi:SNF2 family DNA or RNA helicase
VALSSAGQQLDAQLVTKLKKLMIRHTKGQRIGGDVALALPESDTETVWLTMTSLERQMYAKAVEADTRLASKLQQEGGNAFRLEMSLRHRRGACSDVYTLDGTHRSLQGQGYVYHKCFSNSRLQVDSLGQPHPYPRADVERLCSWTDDPKRPASRAFNVAADRDYTSDPDKGCTKLAALRADLLALRRSDASMHAVVFTQSVIAHRAIVTMLRAAGLAVCEFTGSTAPSARHEAIRAFQASGEARTGEAKVFVITIKTGSVGITLTAASRVYLFEPCFDPATEVQAAGRIHRLGQTQDVLIKRFAFRDSLDENICRLHERLRQPGSSHLAVVDGNVPAAAIRILTGADDAGTNNKKSRAS